MPRSWSVVATTVLVGCSLVGACSSSSKAQPGATTQPGSTATPGSTSTPPTTDIPISSAAPTAAQLAFGKTFLAGEGAALVDFARKTRPLGGPKLPSKAVCLNMKDTVLPSVAPNPAALEALVKKITDPSLQKLFDQNIFWLNGLVDACSRTVLPDLEPANLKVVFGLRTSLIARLGKYYGITVV